MDVVTQSLLKEFSASQKIEGSSEAEQFEAFVNYVVVSDLYPEEFDFGVVATGKGEFGLDGAAIIVNDVLVDDEEQLEDLIAHSPSLQVQFVFTQAKTSSAFDSGDMSKFFQAVADFFRADAEFKQSERILDLQQLKNKLYENAHKFSRGLPRLSMFYATTGTWADDKNLCAIRDGFIAQLAALHIFGAINFTPVDAGRVQKLYFQTKNSFRATINFPQNLSLPVIPNVRESYIGFLSIAEYVKMITDGKGMSEEGSSSTTSATIRGTQQSTPPSRRRLSQISASSSRFVTTASPLSRESCSGWVPSSRSKTFRL